MERATPPPPALQGVARPEILEDELQDAENKTHVLVCKKLNCIRCKYTKSRSQLQARTPLLGCIDLDEVSQERIKAAFPKPWLTSRTTPIGWGLACRLCSAAGSKSVMGEFRFGRGATTTVQTSNLERYADTEQHKQAAVAYVRKIGLSVSDDGLMDNCAPDVACFAKALDVVKTRWQCKRVSFRRREVQADGLVLG